MLSRKGVNIATVKNIHHSFDTSDKDTWRHLEAGAKVTVATTPSELVIIKRKVKPSLNDALASIKGQAELVLVEGHKQSTYSKIVCVSTSSEAFDAVNEISNVVLVTGTIMQKPKDVEEFTMKVPDLQLRDFEGVIREVQAMLGSD
jgi:molybdopterin-guanine dinucleotide biosynthesis protein MobB